MEVETSTPNASSESRRKSGRAVRHPAVFSQENHAGSTLINGSTKRKRAHDGSLDHEDEEGEDANSEEESEDEEDENDEPDEEELKAQRRAKRARAAPAVPATKRTKTTNGSATTLAIRPAKNQSKAVGKSGRLQKARARPSQVHQQGLYAEVFGKGQSPEDAASEWFQLAQNDNVAALRDLVNFILQCIGCDSNVETQDIEDLDSVPNKLGDILQEYEQQKVADYPLVSKQKQYAGFQEVLEEFFTAIIKVLHTSSMFYDVPEVYDNIHVWVATMSGANYKSFRHTATIISLAMSTALCEIAKELQETMANFKKQLDAEKKKKSVNKSRAKTIDQSQKAAETKLEAIDSQLRDAFDTVYVHRYRDVEERIRAPCVAALGNWTVLYRKMFLEGTYLRYLGWVLNDTSASTRLEDIKQLRKLFNNKDNIVALRAFTEKFRDRLVEMGARDADINVRTEAIELLDRLREAELLEPDDIDTIGRLIFDSEPRIRKAVAKFFVSNIEDLYAVTVDDFDEEQYLNTLPDAADVEDSSIPSRSWIKFKCLATVFAGYDNDEESLDGASHSLSLSSISDSRYTLATQAIFHHMPDLHQWEDLAGYLLYDHSSISASGDDGDIEHNIQQAYKLVVGEDAILLDVLHATVKSYLQTIVEPSSNRRTNATKDQIREKQEIAAQNLTKFLPQLLNKFGSIPRAASAILRIEQVLDIGLINDLQSGEATYSAILDDISKQFTSHSDKQVLAAASAALRNARSYEQSKEAADAKVEEIWAESATTLADLLQGKAVGNRGTFERQLLTEVVNIVVRLAELAGVYDCSRVVEGRLNTSASKKQKTKNIKQQTLLQLLLQLLRRGEADEDSTATFAELEDQLCASVIELFSRYFRWKVVGLKQAVTARNDAQLSAEALSELVMTRSDLVEQVAPVIRSRTPLDPVRYHAIVNVLELFALFTMIKNIQPDKGQLDVDTEANLQSLSTHLPEDILNEVLVTFERAEKSFARKTHRKIETISSTDKKSAKARKSRHEEEEQTQEEIEKPPEDSDDEGENGSDAEADDDDQEDEENEGRKSKNAKKQAALLAEQALCELASKLIFAVVGGAIKEEKAVKDRILLNRNKLGKNFSVLVGYLDEKKPKKAPTKKKNDGKAQGQGQTKARDKSKKIVSEEMVLEDDDIEDSEAGEHDPDRPEEEEVDEAEAQRRREVLEDEIDDGDGDGEADVQAGVLDEADDEIMGD